MRGNLAAHARGVVVMRRVCLCLAVLIFGGLPSAADAAAASRASASPPATIGDRSPAGSLQGASCSPIDTITVPHLEVVLASVTDQVEVTIVADGKTFGTESIRLAQAAAPPARLEILRFQPEQRQRLIDKMAAGAKVEARGLQVHPAIAVRPTPDERFAASAETQAEIVRSTWREGGSERSGDGDLQRIFAAQTFTECQNECDWARLDCESNYCYGYPDPQCFAYCEDQYNDCVDLCPCDGFEPILVDEYTETTTHVVSGPHGTICAGNVATGGANKAYYDEYVVFHRVSTYRVWEDCHGNQTTELVSTSDSSNRTCYYYTNQLCSQSPGSTPLCVF